MMEQAFLGDILADPHDVGPRLVFADWLEENGQAERAAMMREPFCLGAKEKARSKKYRAALALVRASLGGLVPRGHLLYLGAGKELVAGRTLTQALGGACWCVSSRDVCAVVRYGFITEVGCSQPFLLRNAARLFARHPIVDVRLIGVLPDGLWRPEGDRRGRPHLSWRMGPDLVRAHKGDMIARPIFAQLPGGRELTARGMGDGKPCRHKLYPDERAAYPDLSD